MVLREAEGEREGEVVKRVDKDTEGEGVDEKEREGLNEILGLPEDVCTVLGDTLLLLLGSAKLGLTVGLELLDTVGEAL